MKKNFKKALAGLLAFTLVLSMFPMVVFAMGHDGALTSVTVNGVEIKLSATEPINFASARDETVTVKIPTDDLGVAAITAVLLESNPNEIAISVFVDGEDAAISEIAHIGAEGEQLGSSPVLAAKSVIWVKSTCGDLSGAGQESVVRILVEEFTPPVGANLVEGHLDGTGSVTNAVLFVELPTNLNFTLDPLEVTGGISQITSTDYVVANRSYVPVQVGFRVVATLADGVDLVDQGEAWGDTTDKDVFFAVLAADDVDEPPLVNGTGGVFEYDVDAEGGALLIPFATSGDTLPDEVEASVAFALAAGTGGEVDAEATTLAAEDAGVASFQFFAEINELAAWAEGDITVKGYYTIRGLRGETFDDIDTIGLNVVGEAGEGKQNNNNNSADITVLPSPNRQDFEGIRRWNSDAPLTIQFPDSVVAQTPVISSTISNIEGSFALWAQTTDWTYADGLLTLTRAPNNAGNLAVRVGGITITIVAVPL